MMGDGMLLAFLLTDGPPPSPPFDIADDQLFDVWITQDGAETFEEWKDRIRNAGLIR